MAKSICNVENCDGYVVARDMCEKHYRRFKKHGHINKTRVRKICYVDGCENFVVSKGLCDNHRTQLRRKGTLESARPKDWGSRDKHPLYRLWLGKRRNGTKYPLSTRLLADFWEFVGAINDRPSNHHHLRPVDESKPIDEDNYQWVLPILKQIISIDDPDLRPFDITTLKDKVRTLYKKYGMTLDDYEKKFNDQNGVCDICGRPEVSIDKRNKTVRALAVDHCHKTGKVRALLCQKCNTALGKFNDDPQLLRKAAEYLEKHQE